MRRNGLQSTSNYSRADNFEVQPGQQQQQQQSANDNGYMQYAGNGYATSQQDPSYEQQFTQQCYQDPSATMGNSFEYSKGRGMNEWSSMPNNYAQFQPTGMERATGGMEMMGTLAGTCNWGQGQMTGNRAGYGGGFNNAMWANSARGFRPQAYSSAYPMGGVSYGAELPIDSVSGIAPGAAFGSMGGASLPPYQ